MDTRLEVVIIPVADVDRAKDFYLKLGWRLDADFPIDATFRVVQLTPPGSPTSVQFGVGLTGATPGSSQAYLVVNDIAAARAELRRLGAPVGEVFHRHGSTHLAGPDPDRNSYGSFATFTDPDGNGWLMQEITARLPGRIGTDATTFVSVADLAAALRRAETAHGKFEAELGHRDVEWPEWYAAFMAREQSGERPAT
jgi:catechol 2,3-dioxygenase-like lactoylglutathione lyase family enzyme